MKVPYLDLQIQYKSLRKEIEAKVKQVMSSAQFVLGEEVRLFENEFADYCGVKYGVGIGSGTDALFLSLLALGIGQGDEVITTSNTFVATALAISFTGAKPVFVDVDPLTYNLDPSLIEKAITKKTKAIMPVHLYGQPADMGPILKIARKYGLKIVEDACQAHGAEYLPPGRGKGRRTGSMGDIGAFSFYPSKNLGAYGDGGMAVTNSRKLYERLRLLRDYGRKSKYEHAIKGRNSRLDNLQAAILRIKLKNLDNWNKARIKNASIYNDLLSRLNEAIVMPKKAPYARHIYHLYVVRVKGRDRIIEEFKKHNIQILIHYPQPIHLQKAFRDLGYQKGQLPITETFCSEVMSLPMYPELTKGKIKFVADSLKRYI